MLERPERQGTQEPTALGPRPRPGWGRSVKEKFGDPQGDPVLTLPQVKAEEHEGPNRGVTQP